MKKIIGIFLFVVLIAPVSGAVQSIDLQMAFTAPPVMDSSGRLVLQADTQRLNASGGPDLPMIVRNYQFPANCRVGDLTVTTLKIGTKPLDHALPVLPMKPTVNGSRISASVGNSLKGSAFYPDRWFDLDVRRGLDPQTLEPAVFATLRVYPVRVTETVMQFIRQFRVTADVTRIAGSVPREAGALFVIGPQSFLDEMSDYISHKEDMGITTLTRSIEDIQANETGRDLPEQIKYAIARAYTENNTRFVLLAGDVDQVPVRYTFHASYGGMNDWQNIPCDLYYADLFDGNGDFCDWDADADDVFGEYANGNVDACDFMPDVLVGRIPASTIEELTGALAKIVNYETNVTGAEDWTNRIVLAGADTFTETNQGDTTGIPEGEATKELIAGESLTTFELVKLYETERYARTDELTTENLRNAIEAGAVYVNFANHGWVEGWAFNGGFTVEDVNALTNADRLPVAFGYACSTAVFDTENPQSGNQGVPECIGEAFVLNPNGGAVGYYGASRTAFAGGFGLGGHLGALGLLDREFFRGVGDGHTVQGRLYLGAVAEMLLGKGLADTADFITMMEFVYFGDPSLSVGGPVSIPDFTLKSLGLDDSTGGNGNGCAEPGETVDFSLHLINDGAAVHNITVQLTIDNPDITVVNGTAALPDLPQGGQCDILPALSIEIASGSTPDQAIPAQITVTSDEGTRVFNRIVYIGENAWLTAEKLWITSDNNNDNFAGPGEHINFAPALMNIGCSTAHNLTGTITIDDTWIRDYGVRTNAEIPDIASWQTFIPAKLFYAEIDPLTPDHHEVLCHITITDTDSRQSWTFDLPFPVLDTTNPLADQFRFTPGDPQPGDTVTMTVRVQDSAGVDAVSGTLHSFETGDDITFDMFDDGAHGDGDAGDDIYGCQITLPEAATYFLVDIYTADNIGNSGTHRGIGGISTVAFKSDDHILVVGRGLNDQFLGLYTQALEDAGYEYDVWSWYRGIPPESVLDQYTDGVVIWFFAHTLPFLDQVERDRIDYYLAHGGNLLITEEDIGWAMVETGTNETEEWYRNTLLAEYVKDATSKRTIQGVAGDPVSDGMEFSINGGSGAKNQDWPSLIDPIAPARTCFTYKDYSGSHTGTAGLRAERDTARFIYLAFGFEGINSQADRRDVMDGMMQWLGATPGGTGCPWDQSPGWWIGPETPVEALYAAAAFCEKTGRIYTATGVTRNYTPVDPKIYYIDPGANTSGSTGVSLAAGRMYCAAATLEDANGTGIYFVGGIDSSFQIVRDIEVYYPDSNTVTTLDTDPVPEDIQGIPGSTIVANNRFYWIGTGLTSPPWQTGDTWEFDPMASAGNRWRNLNADLIEPRFFAATALLDNKIYLVGGITQVNSSSVKVRKTVSILDLSAATPEWDKASVSDLPDPLCFCAGTAVSRGSNVPLAGHILVAGGADFTGSVSPGYIYDPDKNAWQTYWPTKVQRLLNTQLLLIPSARGPEAWAFGGFYEDVARNFEIFHLGGDPTGAWINIRTNQGRIPSGCTFRLDIDIAGNPAADSVDCYIAMDLYGEWFFLATDPVFPTFTRDPAPFFSNVPLSEDVTYSGPLLEFPVPEGTSEISGSFYTATILSGTADLCGGLAWTDFTLGGE